MSNLTRGCVLYWNMEGNANDVSGNNNSATYIQNMTYNTANGKVQQGGNFNGTSRLEKLNANNVLTGAIPRTIAAWCRTSTNPNTDPIVMATSITSGLQNSHIAFYLQNTTGNLNMGTFGPGLGLVGTNIVDGQWHLAVGTTDGTTCQLYIDNVLRDTQTRTITFRDGGVQVGWFNFNGTPGQHWVGSIDEVGIWNRVLTRQEISTLWNGGLGMTYPFVQTPSFLFNLL